jgi:hypothetical protein
VRHNERLSEADRCDSAESSPQASALPCSAVAAQALVSDGVHAGVHAMQASARHALAGGGAAEAEVAHLRQRDDAVLKKRLLSDQHLLEVAL